jgi:nucleotide-binding universal stress UspA family protein
MRLARRLESRLTVAHVIDARVVEGPAVETLAPLWGEVSGRPFQPEVMRVYRDRGTSLLDRFCREAEEIGCASIDRVLEIGVADESILGLCEDADLLVMGKRGEHASFRQHVIGTCLSRVLHQMPCPVLIAGEDTTVPARCVVAYESAQESVHALELAIAYAASVDGEIGLVHAGDERGDAVLATAHGILGRGNVAWESVRIDAEPAEAVLEAARRWKSDCLFMGAHGHNRLHDFLFGSTTSELIGAVTIPIFSTK